MKCFLKIFTLILLVQFAPIHETVFAETNEANFLSCGDSISVWVVGEPELCVDTLIANDGTILMPLIGYINIGNLTVKEAKELIEDAYKDGYLQKPLVHIAIRVQSKELSQNEIASYTENVEIHTINEEAGELPSPEPKILKHAELRIIDAKTKKAIRRAYVHLPRNIERYTDRFGYVRIPSALNLFNPKACVKIKHKAYEELETEIDFTAPQKITKIRLYKSNYEKPEPATNIDKVADAIIASANENILETKVTLSFENEDLKTILETLATEFDLNVSFDEDGKKYTLRAEDVTVRELLKNLLLHRNYQYSLNENELIVVSPAGREQKTAKEILFRDMSLMEALRIMAKMMNINIFVTPNVTDKTVNFYVDYLNLNELLDLLLETNGLKKIKRAPNTYIIDTI